MTDKIFNNTIKVIISGGFHQAYNVVIPEFEKSTGIKVETFSGASQGVGPKTIRYQLANGSDADVVILSKEGLDTLIEDGRILKASIAGIATAPLSVAIRTGYPQPDITTEATIKQTIINSRKIVAPGSTSGQFVRDKIFPLLQIPDTISLTLLARGTECAAALKSGEANLLIGPTSELVNIPGIDMIGDLPASLQIIQTFTAGIVNNSRNPEAARRLIDFLTADDAQIHDAIRTFGMEPVKRI